MEMQNLSWFFIKKCRQIQIHRNKNSMVYEVQGYNTKLNIGYDGGK